MILFKIDWPGFVAKIISISANVAHKFKRANAKIQDLKSKFPKLPKPGDVYEDPKHAETPGGMIEHGLDPLKYDPSRKLKKKTVDDYVNDAIKDEAKKTVEEVKKAIDEAVPDEPKAPEKVEEKAQKSFLDKLAEQADDLVKAAKDAQNK